LLMASRIEISRSHRARSVSLSPGRTARRDQTHLQSPRRTT
jgi:hypothetical protein